MNVLLKISIMKKYLTTLFLFVTLALSAQEKIAITDDDYTNNSVEMADVMRSNGKIYVVVAVIMTVFVGLIVYTISIDRKLTRLEKQVFKEKVNS